MNQKGKWLLAAGVAAVAVVLVVALGWQRWQRSARPAPAGDRNITKVMRIYPPGVAGGFYPANPAELAQMIDRMLAATSAPQEGELRGLICPHAGYIYSGPVAAAGYKQLIGRNVRTVIILGPSHHVWFQGAVILNADAYQTPLGAVPISPQAADLAQRPPFLLMYDLPTADQPEHSVEVQIPFLQRVLKDFAIVPVVCGAVEPAQAAHALGPMLDDQTIVVASSDLSHYYPYDTARARDQHTVDAICNLDIAAMEEVGDACGKGPILTLMHLARQRGWKAKLLDCRNSGDTTGDKARVVGYAAIAFYGALQPPAAEPRGFDAQDRAYLLGLARQTIAQVVRGGGAPTIEAAKLAAKFTATRGVFVTLTENGALRGCIGQTVAQEPVYQAVIDMAQAAALHDYRFGPVGGSELDRLHIEVSILTPAEPLAFTSPEDLLSKLQPYRDGVVLQLDAHHTATFLPQVWEQIPGKEKFLDALAEKAGCPARAWRAAGTKVLIYHVESFAEAEP